MPAGVSDGDGPQAKHAVVLGGGWRWWGGGGVRAAVASTGPGQRAPWAVPPIRGRSSVLRNRGLLRRQGCPSNLLCCDNGCVHVCRNPVFEDMASRS
ncbi:Protein of unknown function [Gryllus bimaculatus]|nr:Protein of unknown function [Gryllus bimaculatus]